MMLTKEMLSYIAENIEDIKRIIRDLCAIPAPSHHEENRAEYCKAWFRANGFEDVEIDEALNVVCRYQVTDENDLVVFMAHTDTVFPDTEPMPFREDEKKMYAPGVCDDTANLAVMMVSARYFVQRKLRAKRPRGRAASLPRPRMPAVPAARMPVPAGKRCRVTSAAAKHRQGRQVLPRALQHGTRLPGSISRRWLTARLWCTAAVCCCRCRSRRRTCMCCGRAYLWAACRKAALCRSTICSRHLAHSA